MTPRDGTGARNASFWLFTSMAWHCNPLDNRAFIKIVALIAILLLTILLQVILLSTQTLDAENVRSSQEFSLPHLHHQHHYYLPLLHLLPSLSPPLLASHHLLTPLTHARSPHYSPLPPTPLTLLPSTHLSLRLNTPLPLALKPAITFLFLRLFSPRLAPSASVSLFSRSKQSQIRSLINHSSSFARVSWQNHDQRLLGQLTSLAKHMLMP